MNAPATLPLPNDRTLDRRAFLGRMGAAIAAASAGSALLPNVLSAPAAAQTRPRSPFETFHPDAFVAPRPEALADVAELTIAEAAWLIRRGRLHPQTLLEAYLDRIEAFEPTYQAFNTILAGEARARAEQLDGRPSHSPLHGIPIVVKDNYFTAGVPTTCNSFLFSDLVPPFDATTVARLVDSGAIVVGKTQMGPLATTRATTPSGQVTTVSAWNPTNPGTNPGGSSTGTATAVAGRCATSGIGTQTGGSITSPSNAQNLTGLKPTMGVASLFGIIPLTYTRDHPGPLARDAKDAAIMLTAMAGEDANDVRTQGVPPLGDLITAATPVRAAEQVRLRWPTRIGVIPGYATGTSVTAQARRAFLAALDDLPGAEVVDVTLPQDWSLLVGGTFNAVRLPERSEPFRAFLKQDLHGFGTSLLTWLQGSLMGANEWVTGQRAKLLLLERVLDDLFAQCDVVVQTSPVPFDIIGLPEIALPIGATGAGIPIGTILGGQPYAEDRLLAVAAAYQAVSDWHLRRPPEAPVAGGVAPPEPIPADGPPFGPRPREFGRPPSPPLHARGVITAEEAAELSQ